MGQLAASMLTLELTRSHDGTLKRMDYLQSDHPTRIARQCSLCYHYLTHYNMATKKKAKKTVRTTPSTRQIYRWVYLPDAQLSGKSSKMFAHKNKQNVIVVR
jgi:hypothetical protein